MDTHRVVPKSMSKRSKVNKKQQNSVKIVYISTPMKVKTSASQFRALVQELTGRESDIARLTMETNYHQDGVVGKDFGGAYDEFEKGLRSFDVKQEEKSPTTSSSEGLSNLDGIFEYQEQSFVEEEFMIPLDFVFGSSEFDVLGSYDVL